MYDIVILSQNQTVPLYKHNGDVSQATYRFYSNSNNNNNNNNNNNYYYYYYYY